MMKSFLTCLVLLSTFPQGGAADAVVSQKSLGEMACGPCAMYHAMAYGSAPVQAILPKLKGENTYDKVRSLIDRYGKSPSSIYGVGRARYTEKEGIPADDLCQALRECLSDHEMPENAVKGLKGVYLNRHEGETQAAHLLRIHRFLSRSITHGLPPIIEVRSFAARSQNGEFKWEGLLGHFVVIVDVQKSLGVKDKGFTFRYADSATGQIESGFIHLEEARNFTATRAFTVADDGKTEQWEWVTDYPYLMVQSPSLRLLTQQESWHTRTTIVLRYAIGATESLETGSTPRKARK